MQITLIDSFVFAMPKNRAVSSRKRKIKDDDEVPKTKRKNDMPKNRVVSSRKRKIKDDDDEVPKKKPRNDRKNDPITVVKRSLKTFLKNCRKNPLSKILFRAIQPVVHEMSFMATEASIQINFVLMYQLETKTYNAKKKINFLDYFSNLLNVKGHEIGQLYSSIRNEFVHKKNGLPEFYDSSYRANLFRSFSNRYKTNFENNIKMYAYNRVRKYLRNIHPTYNNPCSRKQRKKLNQEITSNLKWLFYAKAEDSWKTMKNELPKEWEKSHFCNVNPYKHLPDFFKIYKYNSVNNKKNFKLLPRFSCKLMHIDYDTTAFYDLLCSVNQCPKKSNGNNQERNGFKFDPKDYFNLPRQNLEFKSFSTNGVDCSVRFYAKPKPKPEETVSQVCDNPNLVSVGIDPGWKLFIGAVRHTDANKYENVTYSSKDFYQECGHYARNHKLYERTKHTEYKIRKDREKDPDLDNTNSELKQINWFQWWVKSYIWFELKWLTEKIETYHKRKIARLKFDGYIRRKKTINEQIEKKIIKGEEKVNVFLGSATQAPNSGIKGYKRYPGKEFRKALMENKKVNLFKTPENYTSQVCPKCLKTEGKYLKVKMSKSPHRYAVCVKCHTTWNRDILAAENIWKIGKERFINQNLLYSLQPPKIHNDVSQSNNCRRGDNPEIFFSFPLPSSILSTALAVLFLPPSDPFNFLGVITK